MRAAYYESNGAARAVLRLGEVPAPTPGPGEVRVKIMASGVKSKASMPDDGRGDRQQQHRSRNPRRDGVKLEGGGQPHRVRKGRAAEARPTPERAFDPMAKERGARERGRQTNNDPRHTSAPAAEAKPEGQFKRRPRNRRPSNGGKGYAAKG